MKKFIGRFQARQSYDGTWFVECLKGRSCITVRSCMTESEAKTLVRKMS